MKILVTGRGTSASFRIRGEQLGKAIGADVVPNATEFKGYDAAIVVKRPRAETVAAIHKAKVPLVWDVIDSFPQPAALMWDRATCLDWLRQEVESIRPAAIVAATKVMKSDCARFAIPVLALPHHARPGQRMNPLREKVKIVGYQGGDYLGPWEGIIGRQCEARGWKYVMDHTKAAAWSLAEFDIVVAMREQTGYAARNYKSGVKLANAMGSGTPSVVAREAGYVETASEGQYFADDEAQLTVAFDALTSIEARRGQVEKYRAPTLEAIASEYRTWLSRLA